MQLSLRRVMGALVAWVVTLAGLALATPPASAVDGFTSTWKTDNPGTSATDQITLPIVNGGSYNFTVDWGDSTSDTITAWDDPKATHTYSSPGTYTVTIAGTILGWWFNAGGDAAKITDISRWGPLNLGSYGWAFAGASNLDVSATDSPDLSGVTNLAGTFQGCSSLTSIGGPWNTTGVTNLSYMFDDAASFNVDIGAWNTSQVTDMSAMFAGATAFNQNIGSWNTSAVDNMQYMFYNAAVFNQNIGNWNTSNVTDMEYMFYGATAFNQNIGGWNTVAVTDMAAMFLNAAAFNQDIGGWSTGSVSETWAMFIGATSFNQDLGGWDVGKLTDARWMFSGSTLSPANYSSLLIGWAAQTVTPGTLFFAGTCRYSNAGAVARGVLTGAPNNWSISDGGPDAQVGTDPASKAYGNQRIGTSSGAQTFTLTNTGSADLTITGTTLTGADSDQFTLGTSTCTTTLTPSSTCTAEVTFHPTTVGAKTADLTFEDNAADTPQAVALSGTGTAPGFGIQPTSNAFGDQTVGTSSGAQTFTLTNTGSADLTITGTTLTGADSDQFTLGTSTCGSAVPPTGTCTVHVAFHPTSTGAKTATITFADDAADSPQQVGLTGTGTAAPNPSPIPAPPAKPAGLKTTATGKKVTGRWKTAAGATGYTAKLTGRNAKKRKLTKTKTTSTTSVKFKVRLKPKSAYKLCVTARNAGGSSPTSCKKGKVK